MCGIIGKWLLVVIGTIKSADQNIILPLRSRLGPCSYDSRKFPLNKWLIWSIMTLCHSILSHGTILTAEILCWWKIIRIILEMVKWIKMESDCFRMRNYWVKMSRSYFGTMKGTSIWTIIKFSPFIDKIKWLITNFLFIDKFYLFYDLNYKDCTCIHFKWT